MAKQMTPCDPQHHRHVPNLRVSEVTCCQMHSHSSSESVIQHTFRAALFAGMKLTISARSQTVSIQSRVALTDQAPARDRRHHQALHQSEPASVLSTFDL